MNQYGKYNEPMSKLQYQLSYWEYDSFLKNLDVAIIGSGIVGLNAAIQLKEQAPKLKVAVFERGPLPIGASTRNAGFACFGSMTELIEDINERGEDAVWQLVEKRWKGLQKLRQRLGDQAIQYKGWGAYELFQDHESDIYEACLEKMDDFNQQLQSIIGHPTVFKEESNAISTFGFSNIHSLIKNQAEGQIHTGEMMKSLLQLAQSLGVIILTGVQIEEFHSGSSIELITAQSWKIHPKQVIIATNGFTHQFFPQLDISPARNQVLITSPIPNLKIKACYHYDRGYYYFRNIDQRILIGGGRNLAPAEETTSEFGGTELIYNALIELLQNVILPDTPFEIDQQWSGILGIGKNKTPIIEEIAPNIVVAARLGGMGVAIGSLAGEEAASLIIG